MRASGTIGRLLAATEGNTAIEFAFLVPAFMLLLLGTLEFARMFWTQSTLQQAVEAAARCASVNVTTCDNAADTASYAARQMYGMTVASSAFTASLSTTCGSNSGNSVTASLPFTFIVPRLFPWSVTLSAQSCFPLNKN